VAQRLAELWLHFAGLETLLPAKGTSILGVHSSVVIDSCSRSVNTCAV
jgi:hypothetical protein